MLSINSSLALLGPTASGKSNLAIEIAKKVKGEVIGLDSRQVYKGMSIGTAQLSMDELDRRVERIYPFHLEKIFVIH